MSRVRQIRVQQNEDLRAIAARELRDPTRWPEIAALNQLRLPFVVASWRPEDRQPGTVIWGDAIAVPWEIPGGFATRPSDLYGADVALSGGQVTFTATGDLTTVVGRENLTQALSHRIKTLRGELVDHPRYGCHVSLALGLPTRPFASLMAAMWVHEALREDARIANVLGVDASVEGDTIRVAARVDAVGDNSPLDLNLVLR